MNDRSLIMPALVMLLVLHCVGWVRADPPATGHPYRRVVSMGPNITESIFAIGAQDRLVGVSEFCQWPPEVRHLRRVGGPASPRLEVISALRPDLIVLQFATPQVQEYARTRGIEVVEITMDSLATIERDLMRLGNLLGCEDRATSVTRQIRQDLSQIAERAAKIPESERPLVFLSLERQAGSLGGILSASDQSFLGEALRLAGGRNAFGDLARPYAEISRETLAARRPQVILELRARGDVSEGERAALIADWGTMASLPAVQGERVQVLAGDYLLIPGPRFASIVNALYRALYPETP